MIAPGLQRKALLIIAVPLLVGVILVLALVSTLWQAEADTASILKSSDNMQNAHRLLDLAYMAEMGASQYVLSKVEWYRDQYRDSVTEIPPIRQRLEEGETANEIQSKDLKEIEQLLDNFLSILDQQMRLASEGKRELAAREVRSSLSGDLLKVLKVRIDAFVETERFIQEIRRRENAMNRHKINVLVIFGLCANGLTAVGYSLFVSKGIVQRLAVILDNSRRIAARQELNVKVAGNDEIATLDSAFHQMAQELNHAEQVRRDFLAMATHDLRSPLTSVSMMLKLFAQGIFGALPEKASNELSKMNRNLSQVIKLINDLLDIEKLQSGKLEIAPENVPLAYIFETAGTMVGGLLQTKNLKLEIPDVSGEVFCDGDKMVEVTVNLLSNAAKFSPDGGTITISTDDTDDFTTVKVSDQGPGIPPEGIEQLFQKYGQLKQPEAKLMKGTGLGLLICKMIVELHGGKIGVTSEVGAGSTFWFSLPKNAGSAS